MAGWRMAYQMAKVSSMLLHASIVMRMIAWQTESRAR